MKQTVYPYGRIYHSYSTPMRIGYPCINLSLECRCSQTFRLASYSEDRFERTVTSNLACLLEILQFNVRHRLLFFRIPSQLIPFASHPICQFTWENKFSKIFKTIGNFIKQNNIRISMHPDQFVVINSLSEEIFERSKNELIYHTKVLDLLGLDKSHKIQIHVGGSYNDKSSSIHRFIDRYQQLPQNVKARLVIENDEWKYSIQDCCFISSKTDIPVLFDSFHHSILNNGESMVQALQLAAKTWQKNDGVPMIDYSSQQKNKRKGTHTETIDLVDFRNFLTEAKELNFDIMLEIKDKEKSALTALAELHKLIEPNIIAGTHL